MGLPTLAISRVLQGCQPPFIPRLQEPKPLLLVAGAV